MKIIIPTGDNLYVKAVAFKEVTNNGIYLPTQIKDAETGIGRVLYDGRYGRVKDEKNLAGKTIYFQKWAGTEIKLEYVDEGHFIVKRDDVLAIIDEQETTLTKEEVYQELSGLK